MLSGREKITVRRRGIDGGQNRCRALKDLVAQAYANTRQVLAAVRDVANERQRDNDLAQPGFGDRQVEQHLVCQSALNSFQVTASGEMEGNAR